jgi:uncharacterized protein (TIGR02145 family)
MKKVIYILFFFVSIFADAQTTLKASFFGAMKGDPTICTNSAGYSSASDIDALIGSILSKVGTSNRFIVMSCAQVDNCQAVLDKDKRPYILFNPNFLQTVRKLNFSTSSIPDDTKDWTTLTILAHEIGHHLNNHLSNPYPGATSRDMELEADKTAGFLIYLMGGTLANAQLAYNGPSVSETGSYTHPPKSQRLEAIKSGWEDAKKKYPSSSPIAPVVPVNQKDLPIVSENQVKDIDGNLYEIMNIGGKMWMIKNLDVSHYNNGDEIPEVKDPAVWSTLTTGAWCYYNNDKSAGEKFGKIYNWYAVNDSRGLAPEGWRIPSEFDWDAMTNSLGEFKSVGAKLKGLSGWEKGGNGNNSSGFSALPGGVRNGSGQFMELFWKGDWWSNTERSDTEANGRYLLSSSNSGFGRSFAPKRWGYSVRCIKNGK